MFSAFKSTLLNHQEQTAYLALAVVVVEPVFDPSSRLGFQAGIQGGFQAHCNARIQLIQP
jgi:hypothetical protein